MQNKKAKAESFGMIGLMFVGFVAIIVGLALLNSIASNAASVSHTNTFTNTSYTAPASGAYSDVTGCQELIGSYTIINASTDGTTIDTNNISMLERVGTDGYKTVSILTSDARWNSRGINATFVCGSDGYVEDSGARGVVTLIVLFMALAIAAVGLIIVIKNGYIDLERI